MSDKKWWDYYSSWWDSDDDYTYKPTTRYKSGLGWSSGRLYDTTSYHSSSYKKSTASYSETADLLGKAYKTVRDMVVILEFPFRVSIQLSNRERYDNTSRRIFVPTNILDETGSEYTDQKKINILCGLGVHEAAHLKYTEYRVYDNFVTNTIKTFIDPVKTNEIDFLINLINILEDERIEDELLSDRPGYLNFIQESKEYQFKSFSNSVSKASSSTSVKTATDFLINLFKLIRYPKDLKLEDLSISKETLDSLRKEIYPLPETTKESCLKAVNLYNKIIDILETHFKLGERSISIVLHNISSVNTKPYNKLMYGFDIDSGKNADYLSISSTISDSSIVEDLVTGVAESGTEKEVYFRKEMKDDCTYEDSREIYETRCKYINKYVPGIRKIIKGVDKNFEFNIYGCRYGKLDETKLVEAYQGVPQVYTRKGEVKTNKTTVCVLVDESGSMRSSYKYVKARDAAILLNEALGDLPGVDLYIYGHTADIESHHDTDIIVYREGDKYKPEFKLSNIQPRFENRDGTAIYEVAKRIRKNTDSKCIMFILSDGEPCAHDDYSYWKDFRITHTRKMVQEVTAMNFEIIQVCIDDVDRSAEMFDNVINLAGDLDNFPKKLGQIIKKSIVSDKKTVIT